MNHPAPRAFDVKPQGARTFAIPANQADIAPQPYAVDLIQANLPRREAHERRGWGNRACDRCRAYDALNGQVTAVRHIAARAALALSSAVA